jgi:predicted nuclease with RNAse H fold
MARPFTTFIGVDLGGGKGKTTAVARLAWRDDRLFVEEALAKVGGRPLYDAELRGYLLAHAADAVCAIDAPLTLPACVRCPSPTCPGLEACTDPTVSWFRTSGETLAATGARPNGKPRATPYTQRAAEVVMHRRYRILPRETLGQGMGPLTARARYLVQSLRGVYRLDHNLIEVYPKATVHQLFGERAAQSYKRQTAARRVRLDLIQRLTDEGRLSFARRPRNWPEFCDQSDHLFDALMCAYTAYLWTREEWSLPTKHRAVFEIDGWIWFPGVGAADLD